MNKLTKIILIGGTIIVWSALAIKCDGSQKYFENSQYNYISNKNEVKYNLL